MSTISFLNYKSNLFFCLREINTYFISFHQIFITRFVFLFLGAFTLIYSLAAGVVLSVKSFRNNFLVLYLSPERNLLRKKLIRILNLSGFGDWMMLYILARNTDRVVFGQVPNFFVCQQRNFKK